MSRADLTLEAAYDTVCPECGERIREGDPILPRPDGWSHRVCPDASGPDDLVAVCPRCFTNHADEECP